MTEPFASLDETRSWSWRNGHLEWLLHDSQLLIHQSIEALPPGTKEAVLLCCRRFGKSHYGVVRAVMRCLRERDKRLVIRIVGPDIKQTVMIVDHIMAKLMATLVPLGLSSLIRPVKSEKMYVVGKSGIYLGGFDSQEDSLRGGEADEILVEETGSSDPEQYAYQMKSVLKPQLLKTRGRMIHLTTLPPVPDHPFTNETIPAAKLAGAFYSYTIYEDPLATAEIVDEAIKDCGGADTIEFKREYLNIQTRDPRIVAVPSFDRSRHVKIFEIPTSTKFQIAGDWGGVRDKTVGFLMTYDFLQDIDLVLDERVFDPNTPTGDIVPKMLELEKDLDSPVTQRLLDVPGQIQVDLNMTHKYEVVSPQKAEWQTMINYLIARIAQNKVWIHPRCKFLALSLESGQLDKHRKDFARTTALGHCDAIAALMYGVRCLDRTNPWGEIRPSRDNAHVWPVKPENEEIADAIVGRTFGSGQKKFGSFRS